MKRLCVLPALLALVLCAIPARAQDAGNGTMHVLRPLMHAEQDEAELCFEFDHDLDASDHAKTASMVKLESAGKPLPLRAANIVVNGNLLCLPSLDYRREYRVVLGALRGAKGEKLAAPYGLSFTAPDRVPSLAFTGGVGGLMRLEDGDPVLRSLNVPRAHVELYRVNDPSSMAEAWRSRQQTTLAPSESGTFGHDHGQKIWESDLALGDAPNRILEQAVPLHAALGGLSPGLYLIVAHAADKPKADSETENLAASGAIWLLNSGLRLHAIRDAQGFYAFTENTDASASLKNVRLLAEDALGQTLGETRSGDDGVGFLPLPADKKGAASLIMGLTDQGDVDFADLNGPGADRFAAPKNIILMSADRPFYAPAAAVSVALSAHDAGGRSVPEINTVLRIRRADGNVYQSFPVTLDNAGTARLYFPAPVTNGIWSLLWQDADGGTLAETPLRVTANPEAPHMEMTADRAVLPADGAVSLTLKSVTVGGRPAPFVPGRIFVAWGAPDNIFHEWGGYRFGSGARAAGDAAPVMSFVTDAEGVAHIKLNLAPPSDDRAALHGATVSARTEPAAGIADPAPLTLPLRPKEDIVGIKPFAPDGHFPENGLARFDIVALNADGRRRGMEDLAWQIYEEGRSFDWYQADGRWNYRLQQQKRRVGGGALDLTPDGDDIVEWPVTAGSYRLEITDANGNLRAAADFGAGWEQPPQVTPAPLTLVPPSLPLQPGQETRVAFTLDRPSMVTAFIGDDHVRKVIHEFRPRGANAVVFTPGKDWGAKITARIEAASLNLAGQTVLTMGPETVPAETADAAKSAAEALTVDADVPDILWTGDSAHLAVRLRNNGPKASWRAVLTVSPDAKLADVGATSIDLAPGETRELPFQLATKLPGKASLRLDVTGPAHPRMTRGWDIPVLAPGENLEISAPLKIGPQQTWSSSSADKTRAKAAEDGIAFLAPEPLFDTPVFLASVLNADPFTTAEIAGTLEVLRLWHGTLIDAGLISETALERQRQVLGIRLVGRQKPDGSFPSMPGGDADIAATAEALMALSRDGGKTLQPAADQASAWLRHVLENTWFDEKERPDRAAAYAALAASGHVDTSSLNYFSDTGVDKKLPPLASARLAMAFARAGDAGKDSFWLDASGMRAASADISTALLPVLAENPAFEPHALIDAMEKHSAALLKNGGGEAVTSFLRAMWFLQDRSGNWSVTVNADRRNPRGVLIASLPAKTPQTIRNTGKASLFILRAQKTPLEFGAAMSRHIYQLNGTEMSERRPLIRGETYLVVLEGNIPADASQPFVLHDDLSPGLRVTGCMPPAPVEADDELAWLKSQTLTPLASCEIGQGGIDMLVARREGVASWRAAYLAKAEWSGNFRLSPMTARSLGAFPNTLRGPASRRDIHEAKSAG